jgi:hypothetical protein
MQFLGQKKVPSTMPDYKEMKVVQCHGRQGVNFFIFAKNEL